jgi:hypothetical protein
MADMWYFAKDQRKLGPFTSAEFKELADTGQLLPTDTVWKEGIEKGVLAAKVKNLFSKPAASAPPAPVAAEEFMAREEPKRTAEDAELPGVSSSAPSAHSAVESSVELNPPPPSEEKGEPEKASEPPPAAAPAAGPGAPPTKKAPVQPQVSAPKSRVFRVVGATGAVILGQDGTYVKYKKKCPKCGTEDSSVRTLLIRSGINRDRYFCQKCKKLQHVEIHGAL